MYNISGKRQEIGNNGCLQGEEIWKNFLCQKVRKCSKNDRDM